MMKRGDWMAGVAVVAALLLAAGFVAAGAAALDEPATVEADVGDVTANESSDANESANESVSPGERLGGVVGVQAAEIDGEVENRSFERRVGPDRSDEERADAVAAKLEENEQRLAALEERKMELEAAREAGNLSHGGYRARMASLAAEVAAIERTANRSAEAAADLPEEALTDRGVDEERLAALRNQASELAGPEVAEMARGIAGPNVGVGAGPPPNAGPPAANETRGNTAAVEPGHSTENRTRDTPGTPGEAGGNASGDAANGGASAGNASDGAGTGGEGDGNAGEAGENHGDSPGNGSAGAGAAENGTPAGNATADEARNGGQRGGTASGNAPSIIDRFRGTLGGVFA
ncbi:hypothetical protein JCM17823_12000 [Halorubrum gandharaense]